VYAVDRRGRGLSGDSGSYALEREVEDVVAFVESLGEPAVLLGHSYGAILAIEAALHTNAIGALVLYEPPLPVGLEVYEPSVVARLEALVAAGDLDAVLTTFMRDVPRVPEEHIATMRAQATWAGRVAAAHTIPRELKAVNTYQVDVRDRFAAVDTPTLLLIGGASPAFLQEPSRVLAETLADSEVAVFEGHMHSAMDTATDAFVEHVLDFAARKETGHGNR
jgi:pimeloyl-ACP methyl ester carboxylesterase